LRGARVNERRDEMMLVAVWHAEDDTEVLQVHGIVAVDAIFDCSSASISKSGCGNVKKESFFVQCCQTKKFLIGLRISTLNVSVAQSAAVIHVGCGMPPFGQGRELLKTRHRHEERVTTIAGADNEPRLVHKLKPRRSCHTESVQRRIRGQRVLGKAWTCNLNRLKTLSHRRHDYAPVGRRLAPNCGL
jgi:hypothetical protein